MGLFNKGSGSLTLARVKFNFQERKMSVIVVIALVIAAIGLSVQVVNLLKRKPAKYFSPEKGDPKQGVIYAFTKGMLPWNKESGHIHPVVFWAGVVYHLGILFAFVILFERLIFESPGGVLLSLIAIPPYLGALIGIVNFIRRFTNTELKLISVPDDFISLALVSIFMGTAGMYGMGGVDSLVFDLVAIVLFLYLPISKIKHMLTFFFSRYFHGAHLGRLGIYPSTKPTFGELDSATISKQVDQASEDKTKQESDRKTELELTDEQTDKFLKSLDEGLTREAKAMISACVHCGMCAEGCHYYMSTNNEQLMPVAKLDKLSKIYRGHLSAVDSALPFLRDSIKLTPTAAMELHDAAYQYCSLCGRCAMTCPMGINTGQILTHVRHSFADIEESPVGLDKPAKTAIEKGNYLGLPVDDVVEDLEWIGEEMEDELDGEEVEVPVDKEADVLYIPHPLELRDFPMIVIATAKILFKSGENFTFSSKKFDTVNYAYYGGNREQMATIVKNVEKAAKEVGVKSIVLSPCGHGFKVLRWDAEKLLGRPFPFKVFAFAEAIDSYIKEGKLSVKKDVYEGKITYHDPCNIARNGGVVDEPRRIIQALSTQFVEMTPSGALNYCCGGGGGLAASGEYGKTRLRAGGVKAEQIRQTGAKTVITNCFNCNTQINEINRKYSLDIKVKSIVELVADSIV